MYFSEFDVVSVLTKAAITADNIEDRHIICPQYVAKEFKPGVMLLLQPASPEVIPYFMTHDEIKRFWPKVEGELTEFYRDSNGDWNKRVYDAPTRTLTETYSTGTTNVTKFNEAGLPIDVRSSTGEWIESTYNKDGYLLTERNSHGQIVNKTYDEHNNELISSISYFDVDEEEGLTP